VERAVTSKALAESAQPIGVRWHGTDVDCRTLGVEEVKVETLATE
jgi:hypothetical protein